MIRLRLGHADSNGSRNNEGPNHEVHRIPHPGGFGNGAHQRWRKVRLKLMTPDGRQLLDFLLARLPQDIAYDDLALLCQGFYIHLDGLPLDMAALHLDKEAIAEAFAALVTARFDNTYGYLYAPAYGANYHRPTDKGHWIEVIASIGKLGKMCDLIRERTLRNKYFATSQ